MAEKYLQLARDAQSSGDPVSAENYFQHAEHYFRLIAVANEQFRQQNPNFQPRPEGGGNDQQFQQRSDESFEDGEEDGQSFGDQPFGTREPQPYIPPTAQPFVQRDNQNYQPREQRDGQQQIEQRQPPRAPQPEPGSENGLPAFITGGAPQVPPPQGQNGYENGGQPDRFPLHRRRRRHRGPRDQAGPQGGDRPDDNGNA